MSTKSEPYYWLECDGCGVRSTENSEHAAWSDVGGAVADAEEDGWLCDGDRELCGACADKLRCAECGELTPLTDADAETRVCADCVPSSHEPPHLGVAP